MWYLKLHFLLSPNKISLKDGGNPQLKLGEAFIIFKQEYRGHVLHTMNNAGLICLKGIQNINKAFP